MLFKQRYSSAALQIKININSLRMEHGTLAIIFLQIPFHLKFITSHYYEEVCLLHAKLIEMKIEIFQRKK
ncbi:hypothetical protein T05_12779 [Trichinella murrelli]|uniref:Uncharacterized protein n=1 Tax=Trichinella murrelli TaxID=144512 RepID=A0A0V0TS80_9BILA|nr:hypothetical protein T05_12779 [Trichinella murrelli]